MESVGKVQCRDRAAGNSDSLAVQYHGFSLSCLRKTPLSGKHSNINSLLAHNADDFIFMIDEACG